MWWTGWATADFSGERQKELQEDNCDVGIGLNQKEFNPDLRNLLWVYTRAAKRLSQWL